MTVEESMHVVFDETNPKLQDQVSKNAYEEDILQEQISAAEKSNAAGNQLAEKEKQSTEKAADSKLPKDWIQPRGLSKDNIIAMQGEFEMSIMGELAYFLRLQVKQLKHGTFLNQSKYCFDLLKKFKMEDCKEAATPISTNCLMDADEAGQPVDSTKYRGLIGSLLYLTASRPDIQFGVCLCARFQANPKESHFKAAKRILKYLMKD